MSSTTGIQNYLSNVFRPIYTYDTTTTLFTPKLSASNIDNYSGNTLSVSAIAVGDANSNVYVGSNAGNPYNILKNCSNVTAVGYGAGSNISNDCNSVYIGWYAGASAANATNVISIGTNSGGGGSSNIFIGTSTGSVGNSNILIGHSIDLSSSSNQIRVGVGSNITIAGDTSKKWVGLGGILAPASAYNHVDISGNTQIYGNVGIQLQPGDRTLDVNGTFRTDDGHGYMDFSNGKVGIQVTPTTYDMDVSGSLRVAKLSNTVDFTGGALRSTKGYYSSSGSVDISSLIASNAHAKIGTLVRGVMIISAQIDSTPTSNYYSTIVYVFDPCGTPLAFGTQSDRDVGGLTTIYYTGEGGINISNHALAPTYTFNWSITQFPLST